MITWSNLAFGPLSNCWNFLAHFEKTKGPKSGFEKFMITWLTNYSKLRFWSNLICSNWTESAICFDEKFGWAKSGIYVTWLILNWTKNWTPPSISVGHLLSYDLNRFFIKSKIFLSSTWNSSTLEVHLEHILEHFLYNCNLINWVNKLQS